MSFHYCFELLSGSMFIEGWYIRYIKAFFMGGDHSLTPMVHYKMVLLEGGRFGIWSSSHQLRGRLHQCRGKNLVSFQWKCSVHGWLVVQQPSWKIWKSMGRMTSHEMENKKCLKPPTSMLLSRWIKQCWAPSLIKSSPSPQLSAWVLLHPPEHIRQIGDPRQFFAPELPSAVDIFQGPTCVVPKTPLAELL